MTPDERLARLSDVVGIFPEFTDMQDVVHATSPDTQRALLAASGLSVGSAAEIRESLSHLEARRDNSIPDQDIVCETGLSYRQAVSFPVEWHVISEIDGTILAEGRAEKEIALPPLPIGIHGLHLKGDCRTQDVNLIVAPARVPSLRELTGQTKAWGGIAALYGLTRAPLKSLADYHDLAAISETFGRHGAAFLGINPVHALGVGAQDNISPYSPTHRGFLNTDHVAVEAGIVATPPAGDLLDYHAHRVTHSAALKQAYETFQSQTSSLAHSQFASFCADGGEHLEEFATYEALSELRGPNWREWSDVGGAGVNVSPDSLAHHKWAQWRADSQLAQAQASALSSGMSLGLYLDLAVGARIGGAESWGAHAAAADGVSLGAPPDQLSPAGQNWQLAALAPRKLQASGYDALRFVLRQNMRHCGVLRIDHALGLNRSFWIPEDGSPGGYIRQPFQSLMAVIAIEATRAGTVIVGEDLGLVPPGFRDEMETRGLYGYSVLQYEKDRRGDLRPAANLRRQSLACFGTHDTPTLAGFWCGRDIEWWEKLGWIESAAAAKAVDQRTSEKRQLAGIKAPTPLPRKATVGLRDTVHTTIAGSPAALVAVQLDDVLLLEQAQNLPGTVDEHPNWRRLYPLTVEEIAASQDLEKTADIMAKSGRASQMRKDIS